MKSANEYGDLGEQTLQEQLRMRFAAVEGTARGILSYFTFVEKCIIDF